MMDRIPRRLRVAFSRPLAAEAGSDTPDEVAFVAYGVDCILSGRTVLEADRLSDMLNAHDEYALAINVCPAPRATGVAGSDSARESP